MSASGSMSGVDMVKVRGVTCHTNSDLITIITMSEDAPLLPSRGLQLAQSISELSIPTTDDTPISGAWDAVNKRRQAKEAQDAYDTRVKELWNNFSQHYCSPKDLDDVVWEGRIPPMLDDALFMETVATTWRNGRPGKIPPSVAHALDLVTFLAAYALLISYVLYPPGLFTISSKTSSFGVREGFLVVLSFRPRFPSYLTLLAFLAAIPKLPMPEDGLPFTLLLIAVGVYTLQLHLPTTPSPLFILSPSSSLPPLFALRTVLARLKPLALFLPVLALCAFLLSLSMADTFFVSATPIETRSAFLLISMLSVIILFGAFILSLSATAVSDVEWRKPFYLTCRKYVEEYYFPAPFGVLRYLPLAYRMWVWRILVAPFAYLMWGAIKGVPALRKGVSMFWPFILVMMAFYFSSI